VREAVGFGLLYETSRGPQPRGRTAGDQAAAGRVSYNRASLRLLGEGVSADMPRRELPSMARAVRQRKDGRGSKQGMVEEESRVLSKCLTTGKHLLV
jgi:hypothetical protein